MSCIVHTEEVAPRFVVEGIIHIHCVACENRFRYNGVCSRKLCFVRGILRGFWVEFIDFYQLSID